MTRVGRLQSEESWLDAPNTALALRTSKGRRCLSPIAPPG